MFEIAASPSSATSERVKGARSAGSSKEGKAVRAELASNCVTAAARRTEGLRGLELLLLPPPPLAPSPAASRAGSPAPSSSPSSVQVLRYIPSSASGSS